jgi:hypothetical protein
MIGSAVALLVSTVATRAVVITDFAETQNSLSFNFSGNGFNDFIVPALPAHVYWDLGTEGHGEEPTAGLWGFLLLFARHLPNGPTVVLGSPIIDPIAAYGTTVVDTKSEPHGAAVDDYLLQITVNDDGTGHWGEFVGSFSAVHVPLPDTGSTALLMGFSLLLLARGRRLARRRQ